MNTSGTVRRSTRVAIVGAALGLIASVAAVFTAQAARGDSGQQNPDFTASCGTDVVVILDESGSIDSSNAEDEVADALRALVDGLNGTGSRMRIVEFSTNARDADLNGTGFRTVDDSFADDVDTYLSASTVLTQNATRYRPRSSSSNGNQQYTNWEAGLREAWSPARDNGVNGGNPPSTSADGTPLIVFITDGDPNTVGVRGNSNGGNSNSDDASDDAVDEIAALQNARSHVLSIAVGAAAQNDNSYGRLTNLTEPGTFQQWTGDGPLDLRTVDALRVNEFDELDDALQNVVYALCGSSLTITKRDQSNNIVTGLPFSLTVESLSGGSSLQWEQPNTSPTIATAPSTRTRSTDAQGGALFKWTPGSLSQPQPWSSSVYFEETLQPGWTVDLSDAALEDACTIKRQGSSDLTADLRKISPAGTPVSGDVVRFDLKVDNGSSRFQIGRADIVNCTVRNNRPATITIAKAITPAASDAQVFGFTGGLGSFDLDVNADPTNPSSRTFTVAAGNYTVTENDLTAASWQLTGIQCGSVTGTASGTPNVANRSVAINATAGSSITCTFTNTKVPQPALNVTKTASPVSFTEPGGAVTYTVQVSNPNGSANPVTITDEDDLVVLNGAAAVPVELNTSTLPLPYPGGSITANTCDDLDGQVVAATPLQCSFTVTYTGRNDGDVIDDTVTVKGTDKLGTPVEGSDSATVTVTDALPAIEVVKSNVEPVDLVAPGGPASYVFTVSNPATAVEDLYLTGVTDVMTNNGNAYATIDLTSDAAPLISNTCNDAGNELVGTKLAPGQSYTCEFTVDATGLSQNDILLNTVTVTGRDDDPNPNYVDDTDDAPRTVLGEAPALSVFKTDNNAQIVEPGSNVRYDLTITNPGTTESVTITRIVDHVSFNGAAVGTLTIDPTADPVVSFVPTGAGTASYVSTTCAAIDDGDGGIGSVLAPNGGSTTCSITLALNGNAGDRYDDTVVVDGVDETGDPVTAENSADTPVVNALPVIDITKTPNVGSVPETGAPVTFTLVITNNSGATDPLTLLTLNDTDFGDLFDASNTSISGNTCLTLEGTTLAPGASVNCAFTAQLVGTVAVPHENTVTVQAADDENTPVDDSDDAEVTFSNVPPTVQITKTANPTTVPESGGAVVYTLEIVNTAAEPVTITSLTDDRFVLTAMPTTCSTAIGTALTAYDGQAGGTDTYTCQFTRDLKQVGTETSHTNVATVVVADDDPNSTATDDDDAVVTYELLPPAVDVTKSDNDASVLEPGGNVTYTVTIANPADATEALVAVTALTDTVRYINPVSTVVYDLLSGAAQPGLVSNGCKAVAESITPATPLLPGASKQCTFVVALSGTSQTVSDTVHVVAVDNDGQPADDDDDETTPIEDRPPAVSIVKSANPTVIADGGSTTYTFLITNESPYESLFLTSLTDDKFADLTSHLSSGCRFSEQDPVELQPKGQPGDSITCVAQLTPDFPVDGIHTNTATVEGYDDEGLDQLGGETDPTPATDSDDETVYASATIRVKKVATPAGEQDFTFGVGSASKTAIAAAGYPELVFDGLTAGSHTVTETQVAGWLLTDIECGQKQGTETATGVTLSLAWGEDVTCTFHNIKDGAVSIAKSVIAGPTQVGTTNQYALTYRITVSNNSYLPKTFQVTDQLTLPAGASAVIGSITSNPTVALDPAWNGSGALTAGPQPIAARTVAGPATVRIDVPVTVTLPGSTPVGGECGQTPSGSRIVLNAVDLVGVGQNPDDRTCTVLPDPDIDLTKQLRGAATFDAETGLWSIGYTLTATNSGDGPGEYDIRDELKFGDGVVVESVAASGPTGVTLDPDFDGVDNQSLVEDVDLAGNTSHVYEIVVTASIDEPVLGSGECDLAGGTAGGFLNEATITTNRGVQPPDRACDEFSTLTLVKDVVNDDGGEAVAADFELTATGDDAVVTGDGTAFAAVPAGDYELDEVNLPGYTAGAWSCTDGQGELDTDDDVVGVAAGADVQCRISNDDLPVDLSLTKSDGGVTVKAGSTFTYTFTVTNHGGRDADLGDPVVVSDPLPAEFEWVSFPNDPLQLPLCTQNGQLLTCEVDPALLTADGGSAVIVATVRALPDTPAGVYLNKATVDTEDDPVCPDGDGCTPPPCPTGDATGPANNVACEETPVVRPVADLAIVKSASVEQTGSGGGFQWILEVTNIGPDAAVGVIVDDAVPASLQVTGVSSSQFACSAAGNDVTCTKTTMAVGESGTITITVAVPGAVQAGTIRNVATVEGSLPDPDLTNNSDDATVTVVEVLPPTTTTPPTTTPPTTPTTTVASAGPLPPTGSNSTSIGLQLAAAAVMVGGFVLIISRRRRTESTVD